MTSSLGFQACAVSSNLNNPKERVRKEKKKDRKRDFGAVSKSVPSSHPTSSRSSGSSSHCRPQGPLLLSVTTPASTTATDRSRSPIFRRCSSSPPFQSSDHSDSRTLREICLSRFVRSERAVKALFDTSSREKALPLHFFALCENFRVSKIALRALIPDTFQPKALCHLKHFLSIFQQTLAHSYLHSVLGTFIRLCQSSFFPKNFLETIKRKSTVLETPESLEILEQSFHYLVKMLVVTIPEIPDDVKFFYHTIFSRMDSFEEKRGFCEKFFLLKLVCSALAKPEESLNMDLCQGMKSFCSVLASILEVAILRHYPERAGKTVNKIAQGSYVQNKLELFSLYLSQQKEEEELIECYTDFLRVWEKYHHPCDRNGDKWTCWMREPSEAEALLYFRNLLDPERTAEMASMIAGQCRMGSQSLDAEAFENFSKWVHEEEEDERRRTADLSGGPTGLLPFAQASLH